MNNRLTWKRRQAPPHACLLLPAALMMLSPAALAQDPAPASGKSFAAEFFAAFNPVSAEDMVRRLPGFTLDSGDDRRGFAGAAGNVLINGERPSSKTPLAELLSRISARDVLRMISMPGVGDGDLSGQTMVADVRLRPQGRGGDKHLRGAGEQDGSLRNINPLLILTSGFKVGDVNVNPAPQAQPSASRSY